MKNSTSNPLRIGYVPLIDCAPLIVAGERRLFERHGLTVKLSREPGWATIRDKILYGELEAAHALAGLALSMSYGLGSVRQHCVSAFLFNTHGNAITLSKELCQAGITDANLLAAHARTLRRERPITLASVHPFSSHHFILRTWLRQAGMVPGRDVQIVTLPPPLVGRNLELGHIDGFCVGEPWNTICETIGAGKIVATSPEISPMHPEKALIVRRTFADRHTREHQKIIRALHEACRWCDDPANRPELARILSRRHHLGLPEEALLTSLNFHSGDDFHLFSRFGVNRPGSDKADWLLGEMRQAGLLEGVDLKSVPKPSQVFREDLYSQALSLTGKESIHA